MFFLRFANHYKMSAKVTYSVSMYNSALYIEKCARSLFEQTLEDIEFIFVDDASTDGSVDAVKKILEDYPQRKNQVRFVVHERNMGSAASKRDSYLYAKGEYVIVADSDDYAEKDAAEILYNKAKAEDADLVVCSIYQHFKQNTAVLDFWDNKGDQNEAELRKNMILCCVPTGLWCHMVRRDLILVDHFVWPTANFAEDVVISVQMACFAKKIAWVDVPLYHYVYTPQSICSKMDGKSQMQRFFDFVDNYDLVVELLKNQGIYETYHRDMFICYQKRALDMLRMVKDHKGRRQMLKTRLPELEKGFLKGGIFEKPTYREKIYYLAIVSGTYPYVHHLLHDHKFFRLRPEWNNYWN